MIGYILDTRRHRGWLVNCLSVEGKEITVYVMEEVEGLDSCDVCEDLMSRSVDTVIWGPIAVDVAGAECNLWYAQDGVDHHGNDRPINITKIGKIGCLLALAAPLLRLLR